METVDAHIKTLRDWSEKTLAMPLDKGAAAAALKDIGGSLPKAALKIAGDPFPFLREAYRRRVFGGEAERVTLAQLIEFRDVRDRVLAGAIPSMKICSLERSLQTNLALSLSSLLSAV